MKFPAKFVWQGHTDVTDTSSKRSSVHPKAIDSKRRSESSLKEHLASTSIFGVLPFLVGGCGGSSGDTSDLPQSGREGVAYKGLLHNFRVFVDENGNGVFDAGESNSLTDAQGRFALSEGRGSVIFGESSDQTVDMSSGRVVEGLWAAAPAEASVITPFTTILAQTDISEQALRQAFGFNVNLLHYNPFSNGNVSSGEALAIESVAQQLANITRSLTAFGEGSGVNARASFDFASLALNSVVETHVNTNNGGTLNLSEDTTIRAIMAAYRAELEAAGNNLEVFDTLSGEVLKAIALVNQRIIAVDSLTSIEARAVYGLPSDLYAEIKAATIAIANGEENPGLSLDRSSAIETQVSENGYAPDDSGSQGSVDESQTAPATTSTPPAPAGPAPVLTVNVPTTNFTVQSDIDATLEVTGGGVLGNLLAGQAFTLQQQVNLTTGTLFARANGQTSATSAQTFTLGTVGDDNIVTGAGADFIFGGDGNDIISAGGGDDIIIGGGVPGNGFGRMSGGEGLDEFRVINGMSLIGDLGNGGNEVIVVANGAEARATTLAGVTLGAGSSNQGVLTIDLFLTVPPNSIVSAAALGGPNGVTVRGNREDDILIGSAQADVIEGGLGDDIITGGAGADTLTGGDGDDNLIADDNDVIDGGAHTDTVVFTAAVSAANLLDADLVNVENVTVEGAFTFDFSAQAEALNITGDAADNIIIGGGVPFLAFGFMTGGAGLDQFSVSHGTVMINDLGTGGNEVVSVANGAIANATVIDTGGFTLGAGSTNDGGVNGGFTITLDAGVAHNAAVSVAALGGNTGVNMTGNANDNILIGSDQRDVITGGLGDDTITGGAGGDTLTGGAGADTFVFSATNGTDTIVEFVSGTDLLNVDALVTNVVGAAFVTYDATATTSVATGSIVNDAHHTPLPDANAAASVFMADDDNDAATANGARMELDDGATIILVVQDDDGGVGVDYDARVYLVTSNVDGSVISAQLVATLDNAGDSSVLTFADFV